MLKGRQGVCRLPISCLGLSEGLRARCPWLEQPGTALGRPGREGEC